MEVSKPQSGCDLDNLIQLASLFAFSNPGGNVYRTLFL